MGVMEFTGYAMSTRSRVNNDNNYGGYHMSTDQNGWYYQRNEHYFAKKETICVDEKRQPHRFSNPDEAHNDNYSDESSYGRTGGNEANNPTEGSGQLYTTEFRQTIFSGTYPGARTCRAWCAPCRPTSKRASKRTCMISIVFAVTVTRRASKR